MICHRPKVLKPLFKGVTRASISGVSLLSEDDSWDNGEEDDWTDDEWSEDEGWGEEEDW